MPWRPSEFGTRDSWQRAETDSLHTQVYNGLWPSGAGSSSSRRLLLDRPGSPGEQSCKMGTLVMSDGLSAPWSSSWTPGGRHERPMTASPSERGLRRSFSDHFLQSVESVSGERLDHATPAAALRPIQSPVPSYGMLPGHSFPTLKPPPRTSQQAAARIGPLPLPRVDIYFQPTSPDPAFRKKRASTRAEAPTTSAPPARAHQPRPSAAAMRPSAAICCSHPQAHPPSAGSPGRKSCWWAEPATVRERS